MDDPRGGPPERPVVYTIGHSNHSIEAFLALLRGHGITVVVDVRSRPFSRRFPHFNRDNLRVSLRNAQVQYLFRGRQLGPRPADPAFYRRSDMASAKVVDFEKLAESSAFRDAIQDVLKRARHCGLALMCAEKEPLDCHRTILVARRLKTHGAEIRHILYDGSLEDHAQTEERLLERMGLAPYQPDLFTPKSELLEEAYATRARQIAYTLPEEEGGQP